MKISVIVPAYNEEKFIGKTIQSVQQADRRGLEMELIVVNGGSTDRTAEIAKSLGARVLDEPHRGIGFARQQGLLHAKGDIVLFTDSDTTVPKNWIIRHVDELKKPGVSLTYGTFHVTDGTFPYYQHVNYIQPLILWFFHHVLYTPIAAGQNHAFWREKALAIGGFDDTLPVMEDIDFASRMRKVGKVVFLMNLVVYSSGRRSKEGLGFYSRMTKTLIDYYIFRNKKLNKFPDYR